MTDERFNPLKKKDIMMIRSKTARGYLSDLKLVHVLHSASNEILEQRINHPFTLQKGLLVHEADYRGTTLPLVKLENGRYLDGNITLEIVYKGGFRFFWRSTSVRGLQSGTSDNPVCIVFGIPGETVSTAYFAVLYYLKMI